MNNRNDLNRNLRAAEDSLSCARAADLVTYLYDEASEGEARSFERHLKTCASCAAELRAFKEVNASIRLWRQESLGFDPVRALAPSEVRQGEMAADVASMPMRKRSAIAALREFFAFSPTWMRAATGFASLLICVLIVLAIAHTEVRWNDQGISFSTGLTARTPSINAGSSPELNNAAKRYTQEELNAIVAEKVRIEREQLLSKINEENKNQGVITIGGSQKNPVMRQAVATTSGANSGRNSTGLPTPSRTSVQRTRQNALARDRDEEDSLPRLSDLLSESR